MAMKIEKILSCICVVVILMSVVPVSVFAVDDTAESANKLNIASRLSSSSSNTVSGTFELLRNGYNDIGPKHKYLDCGGNANYFDISVLFNWEDSGVERLKIDASTGESFESVLYPTACSEDVFILDSACGKITLNYDGRKSDSDGWLYKYSYTIEELESEPSLAISVWTDKSKYNIGETVTIYYQTNTACTAKLTVTKPDGTQVVVGGPNDVPVCTRSKSAAAGYPTGTRTVTFDAWTSDESKKATCYFDVVEDEEETKPVPKITKVDIDPSTCVKEDEYATISVTVANNGGASSEGYISVSFPNDEDVYVVSGTGNKYNKVYQKDDLIWNSAGVQMKAVDPLVELFDTDWGEGQHEIITMNVKPNSGSDEIVFYVRAALKNDADVDYERDPTYSSYKDQQGWYVKKYSVDVCEYEKVKIRGKIIADQPFISYYNFDVKIDEVLEDPTGNLQEGETVNVYGHLDGPAQVDVVTVGDEVEVYGEYRGYVGTYEQIFLSEWGDSSSDHYVKKIDGKKPKLCTSPDPPSHNFGDAGVPKPPWYFYITNCGDGELTWSVSDDRSWITVEPTSGSTTTETDTVAVMIDTQGLSPGTHTGHVTVTSEGGSKKGTITVNVPQPEPKLCTSPDPPSHNFGTVPEDETRTWNFDITNCGDGTLTWSVSDDSSWITKSPTSGSTMTETDTIKVTIDTQGLSPGTHTGHVTVTSNYGTKKGTITVNVPQPEPKLCTSPDPPSHNFGTVPEDETRTWNFDITNCGDGTLTWSVSDDSSWITKSPTSGSTTTETDTIKVTIDTQGLSPGTHTGHVTVTSNDGTKKGTITVNVPVEEDINAKFDGFSSVPKGVIKSGKVIQPTVWVKNTGDVTHEFFVSMYIENWDNSKYNYEVNKSIIVDPGISKSVKLSWTVPSEAPGGIYKVIFVLWESRVNGELEGELAGKTYDSFRIANMDYEHFATIADNRAIIMDALVVRYSTQEEKDIEEEWNKELRHMVSEGWDEAQKGLSVDPKSGHPIIDGIIELYGLFRLGHEAQKSTDTYTRMVDIIDGRADNIITIVKNGDLIKKLKSKTKFEPERGKIIETPSVLELMEEYSKHCRKEAEYWRDYNNNEKHLKNRLEREAETLGQIRGALGYIGKDKQGDHDLLMEYFGGTMGGSKDELTYLYNLYSALGYDTEYLLDEYRHMLMCVKGIAECPVYLHAYDSEGNHVGVNSSGGVDLEIPNAYYSGPSSDPQIIEIHGEKDCYFVIEALDQGVFNFTTKIDSPEETNVVKHEHVSVENDTTAIVILSGEGYSMDIDKDGDNITDYTVDPTSVETNHPPEVSIMPIADEVMFKGDISISYTLKDIDIDVCNISARYSTDQMIWYDATIGSGGDGTIGLSSSADGVTHTYVWASGVDLPDVSSLVYFEIRPNDGMADGIHGLSNAFYVGEVTASFTYSPSNPSVNENIVFSAYASIGNITNYTWNFDDGTTTSTDAPIIMHSYASAGDYSVILTVTDKEGATNAISRVVSVAPQGSNDFDTGFGSYPSAMGTHTGTITPNQDINVSKLYTYPCTGTGGHTEHVRIYGNDVDESASWNGYAEDWHNITFDLPFTLEADKTYNYVMETGSYPQIHHTDNLSTPAGFITCSEFRDVNGKRYSDWIPAIRLT